MFFLIAGISQDEIQKGMDTIEHCTQNDIHEVCAFSEEQEPVIWMNSQSKKGCISHLVLDLMACIPIYNQPLTVYVGKDNAFRSLFSHSSARFFAATKVSKFYDDSTTAEQRKKLSVPDMDTRYFHGNAALLESSAKKLFSELNFAQKPIYKVTLSQDGFTMG